MSFRLDDRGGMDLVVSRLLSIGYKRLGFFGLCPEMTWSCSRFGAFVEAMVRHGQEIRLCEHCRCHFCRGAGRDRFLGKRIACEG